MPKEQTELQKLFPSPNSKEFIPSHTEVAENAPEKIPEDLKNRHIRRLEDKLQKEREAGIAMASRIEALSEVGKFRQETGSPDEIESKLSRIYGTDTPEKAEATRLLLEGVRGMGERAKTEAIEQFRSEQKQRESDTQKEVAKLENYIEQIEDQYGIDLSSTSEARGRRTQYIELLEKLSPKQNGEVVDYADPFETWDIFASRQGTDRSKTLASRGMTNSRTVESSIEQDATLKFLKEQGLLEPF